MTPWQEFSESRAKHLAATWKLAHLPVSQQVEALDEGLRSGKNVDVFYYLKLVEDPTRTGIKRPLTEALLDFLGDVAAFPGDDSPLAVELLKALPQHTAGRIEAMLDRKTDEWVKSEDEEVWIYTAVLLREFSQTRYEALIEVCRSNPSHKLNEVISFF